MYAAAGSQRRRPVAGRALRVGGAVERASRRVSFAPVRVPDLGKRVLPLLWRKFQTDQQRMPGFDTARSRQVSHRRRSARQIEIFVNGVIVQQFELYATEEGFFLSGRGGEPFTHRVA